MKSAMCLVLLAGLGANAQGGAPIPENQGELGWLIGNTDVVVGQGTYIELYGDFQCPDTRDTWLNVFKDLDAWIVSTGQAATVRYVPFPLPYHFNAYRASWSAIVATALLEKGGMSSADAFRGIANAALSPAQDTFQNVATANMTNAEIYGDVLFPIFAKAGLPASAKAAFMAGVAARENDLTLRTNWKYGCSRGVTGTPVFSVNGVVTNDVSWWALADWKSFIAPSN